MNKKKLIIVILAITVFSLSCTAYCFYRKDNIKLNKQEEEKVNYDKVTEKFIYFK